jgi:uncharacterized cupredoxin-like copper-binding protein
MTTVLWGGDARATPGTTSGSDRFRHKEICDGLHSDGDEGCRDCEVTLAGPGDTVQVTFTVPSKPGRYPFICTFVGHYQAGMTGTLVVK